MKTTLFLSVSIDGMIADSQGIPSFPEPAWEDWCSLVNQADNVVAGRTSFEQLAGDETAAILNPTHKIVLSTRDVDVGDSGWQHARTPAEALEIVREAGVDEAIIGGGTAVAHSFMSENLVDEIVIDLQPAVFGSGAPMFGDVLDPTYLKLIESQPLNDDVLRLRYQVLR